MYIFIKNNNYKHETLEEDTKDWKKSVHEYKDCRTSRHVLASSLHIPVHYPGDQSTDSAEQAHRRGHSAFSCTPRRKEPSMSRTPREPMAIRRKIWSKACQPIFKN